MVRLGSQGHPAYKNVLETLLSELTSNDTLFLERLVQTLKTDSRYPETAKEAAVAVWERAGVLLKDARAIGLSALEYYSICSADDKEAYLDRALAHLDASSFPVERSRVLNAYGFRARRYLTRNSSNTPSWRWIC